MKLSPIAILFCAAVATALFPGASAATATATTVSSQAKSQLYLLPSVSFGTCMLQCIDSSLTLQNVYIPLSLSPTYFSHILLSSLVLVIHLHTIHIPYTYLDLRPFIFIATPYIVSLSEEALPTRNPSLIPSLNAAT